MAIKANVRLTREQRNFVIYHLFIVLNYMLAKPFTGKIQCKTNLICVMEDWRKAMDNRECIAILSTDVSKAFDSLHHALIIIIKKLGAYRFSDMSL